MEGRLRNEPLTIEIRTTCAHCNRGMTISVDSDLRYDVADEGAEPIVFEPRIDWSTFREPNIIGHY